jgi:RNA-binding protein YlmH
MSQTLQNVLEQIRLLSPDELEELRQSLSLEELHIFDTEPLSDSERQRVLIQAGLRAGWDDPEMDVYNSLDPRKAS